MTNDEWNDSLSHSIITMLQNEPDDGRPLVALIVASLVDPCRSPKDRERSLARFLKLVRKQWRRMDKEMRVLDAQDRADLKAARKQQQRLNA